MSTEKKLPITYHEALKRASSFLEKKNESPFVAEWLLRERLNWTKTDLVKHHRDFIPESQLEQFQMDVNEYLQGRPMQHIIGHEWFYHRKFKVTNDTLIPRPETEEWLDHVLEILPKKNLKALDIGTGTGIIAITYKLERPVDTVFATDISEDALKVAKQNANRLEAAIHFRQGDLFEAVLDERFDVIISNPPYIAYDELDVMDQSVKEYEPGLALFAKDDGLAIYKQLAKEIKNYIHPNGYIFLEIGYKQGSKVAELFKEVFPKATIEIWQDFNQLDRVVAIFL